MKAGKSPNSEASMKPSGFVLFLNESMLTHKKRWGAGVCPCPEKPGTPALRRHHINWAGSPTGSPRLLLSCHLRSTCFYGLCRAQPRGRRGISSFQVSGWPTPLEGSAGSGRPAAPGRQQPHSFLCVNTEALIASSHTWDRNYSVPPLCR